MPDPFAPMSQRFPDVRLARAGLSDAKINGLREQFDAADPEKRAKLTSLIASVSDADLTDGKVLDGWDTDDSGRELTDQEKEQAGQDPTDGSRPPFDPTGHSVTDVDAYLDGVAELAEVDRVADAEEARTDREPRKGVADSAERARHRLARED